MDGRIAIVAPGAMGAGLGARLAAQGVSVLTDLSGRSSATANRAREAGMIGSSLQDIVNCGMILSVVPPSEAIGQSRRFASLIAESKNKPVYVDLNAKSPQTSQTIEGILAEAGAKFIDGAIIGNPPSSGYDGPYIYVSGPHADLAMTLASMGLNVTRMDEPTGAASGLKMAFAGIMKGLTALGAGMLVASAPTGDENPLLVELRRSQPDLARWFERQIPFMYPKTYRWVGEMQEIAAFLGPDDPLAEAFVSIANFFEELSSGSGTGPRKVEILQRYFPARPSRF